MNKLAKRAWFALALAGVLLLGMGVIVVRYFIDSPDWVTFQNSPHVYTDGVMNSGKIVDRSGTVVLDATNGKSYADSASLRRSMLHLLGDREGNITPFLLQEYGSELVGFDRINGTYSTGKREGRMMLTVSADVQRTALAALDGRKGTVGVYNYKTGEILCAVSSPTYDPDDVPDVEGNPETYEGVYVNRFLHATYTPGSVFKLVTAAAALDEIPDIGSRTFTCEGSAVIGGETIQCNGVHGTLNFEEALAHSCNVVFGEIAAELGPKTLMRYAEQVGVTRRYSFDGTTTAAGSFDVSDAAESELAWAGIGQYTDQINPCQYMTYMGAIANGGSAAEPYLVKEVTYGDSVKYKASTSSTGRLLDSATADRLADHDAQCRRQRLRRVELRRTIRRRKVRHGGKRRRKGCQRRLCRLPAGQRLSPRLHRRGRGGRRRRVGLHADSQPGAQRLCGRHGCRLKNCSAGWVNSYPADFLYIFAHPAGQLAEIFGKIDELRRELRQPPVLHDVIFDRHGGEVHHPPQLVLDVVHLHAVRRAVDRRKAAACGSCRCRAWR